MKRILSILAIFLTIGLTSFAAGPGSVQEKDVLAKLNTAASALKSMQCDFVQTKYLSLLSDKMVSEGCMYYRQPDKLRWEYTTPYQYLSIFNGTKVYIGNDTRRDIIDTNTNKIFKEVARIMMNTVTGKALSDQAGFTTTVADKADSWIVTLVPKKKELRGMFAKICLTFSKKREMISEINLYEKNGDHTNIALKNIKVNSPADESIFIVH